MVALLGAGTSLWATHERERVCHEIEHGFEAHAASVARLIREGAREAAASIDTIYALSERNLATTVRLFADTDPDRSEAGGRIRAAGFEVLVMQKPSGLYSGVWGAVAEDERPSLIQEVMRGEPGRIVETSAARGLGLFCARYETERGNLVACRQADELSELRRRTGIGPLLRQVAQRDVVYAAIQDSSGIIAASPGARLSSWSADPMLAEVLERNRSLTFRTIEAGGGGGGHSGQTPLFEGLGSIRLPDGSSAVLRVGVDASSLASVRRGVERRHRMLLLSVISLVLLSVAAAWFLDRWNKRRLQMERQLAEREEENRRWQTVGQMAATVAHEVRNPLNTIKMAAQRLGGEFRVPEEERAEYAELVGLLQSESDRVDGVVTEFLELGRPVTLQRESTPCDELIEQAVLPLRLRADKEAKLFSVAVEDGREVRLDRRRFGQIITNLVGNALDAVPEAGSVRVSALVKADTLEVAVEDDGPGMDEQTLRQVQQPFFTTKVGGTGLGLPLAVRLAEAHGGQLSIDSSPGRGTRVRLLLPLRS
jgi:signal transduction histidine kinase